MIRTITLLFGAVALIALAAGCSSGTSSKDKTKTAESGSTAGATGTIPASSGTVAAASATAKALKTLSAQITVVPGAAGAQTLLANGTPVPPEVATAAAQAASATEVVQAGNSPVATTAPLCTTNPNVPNCATTPPEPTPKNADAKGIAIDANPSTAGVDTNAVAAGAGQSFTVGLNIVTVPEPYRGFEWNVITSGPVEYVSDEQAKPAGLSICSTTTPVDGGYYGGCLTTERGITYAGAIGTVTLRCTGAGTGQVRLKTRAEDPNFGTGLINADSQPITGDVGPPITVNCG